MYVCVKHICADQQRLHQCIIRSYQSMYVLQTCHFLYLNLTIYTYHVLLLWTNKGAIWVLTSHISVEIHKIRIKHVRLYNRTDTYKIQQQHRLMEQIQARSSKHELCHANYVKIALENKIKTFSIATYLICIHTPLPSCGCMQHVIPQTNLVIAIFAEPSYSQHFNTSGRHLG